MIALDTNVLVYAFDRSEGAKHIRAQEVVVAAADMPVRIPLQAVGECYVALVHKRRWPRRDAKAALQGLLQHIPVQSATLEDATKAMALGEKHGLSYWNSLIICVAAAAGCDAVLSEDLQDRRLFSAADVGRALRIINPFDDANLAFLRTHGIVDARA